MKKALMVILTLLFVFTFTACDTSVEDQELQMNTNSNVIGMLSYISASFLNEQIYVDTNESTELVQLTMDQDKEDKDEKSKTAIEDELDRVNVYVDKLKRFIKNGTEDFGHIVEQPSDREEYEYVIQVVVDEEGLLIYYNVDLESAELTGILILEGVEYNIIVENSLIDLKEEENQSKKNIKMMARNGTDMLIVEYKLKQEEDEMKQAFSIVSNIDGIIKSIEIEVKNSEDKFILSIVEDGKEYTFKSDEDEDGKTSYKLEYLIDGIKGKVQIIEKTNDDGETVYVYRIQEKNEKIEIELEDPDNIVEEVHS